ncbi:hypothetical protein MYAM1_001520 [Malassezia yamatoensis]|uniref:Rhamnogalacturonase A/B/Epimerase-like pectate lyase domain-containing protein n=1 Tax=Malassezia yamatoensis TaxID=253288 RepID=A0AAJ6CHI3_9BASI|nr:hypothetical protein MYAM1_001520 [Malassezia yamatoensis]
MLARLIDYGAKADGITDDTAAINRAITNGARCGSEADSCTTAPALVYLPCGTYRLSAPIISYYNTYLVGDAAQRPVLKPLPNFQGIAVIDENPYEPGGKNWYIPQNNFFRSVENLIIDLTAMPASSGTGIHHQVSQATGLNHVHFEMIQGKHSNQQGIMMENGSGGFMSNLSFCGGRYGAWVGNQQFTVRNAQFRYCQTAICQHWNWSWTYMNICIEHCEVGIQVNAPIPNQQGVGSLVLTDFNVRQTPVFVQLADSQRSRLILDHITVSQVDAIVQEEGQPNALLEAPQYMDRYTVDLWIHTPPNRSISAQDTIIDSQDPRCPVQLDRPRCLVDKQGNWFGQEKPSLLFSNARQLVSVRDFGAKGDGFTDDHEALQSTIDSHIGSVIFFPYGIYLLRKTLQIPPGTFIVGEAQPTLLGVGAQFDDAQNPRPVVRVGRPGDHGEICICDMIFSTRGPTSGAVVVEWNIRETYQGSVAMFDSHIRIGGFCGSELDSTTCSKQKAFKDLPVASFLNLHITQQASGYFQNVWIWTADHCLDHDAPEQINVLSTRGILIQAESGPVWMYGTASEHQLLYQYSLVNAQNVLLAMIQTESPYFQGESFAAASRSATTNPLYPDPDCARRYAAAHGESSGEYQTSKEDRALGLHIRSSKTIFVLGAGLYSFFDAYQQDALADHACQRRICVIDDEQSSSNIWLVNLATVGVEVMLTLNGQDLLHEKRYRDGFCSTISLAAIRLDSLPDTPILVL